MNMSDQEKQPQNSKMMHVGMWVCCAVMLLPLLGNREYRHRPYLDFSRGRITAIRPFFMPSRFFFGWAF